MKKGRTEQITVVSASEKNAPLLRLDFSDFFIDFENSEPEERLRLLEDLRFVDKIFDAVKILLKQRLYTLELDAGRLNAEKLYKMYEFRYQKLLQNYKEAVNTKPYITKQLLLLLHEIDEKFLFALVVRRYKK